jgi:hypothetical protein
VLSQLSFLLLEDRPSLLLRRSPVSEDILDVLLSLLAQLSFLSSRGNAFVVLWRLCRGAGLIVEDNCLPSQRCPFPLLRIVP